MARRLIAKGPLSSDGSGVYVMQVIFDQNGDASTEMLIDEPVPIAEVDARIEAFVRDGQFDGVWTGPIP